MFPDQQNNNGGQPGYRVNSAPQQAPNGQYAVVPPLPPGQNTGHSGHNPYEFIVNPNTPKRRFSPFGGGSFVKQIALIVGAAVVVMVVIAVLAALFIPKGDKTDLGAIAERQQEIVRVATEAAPNAVEQDAKNFLNNVELAVTTSQNQTVAYMNSNGISLSSGQLAADQDSQTDTELTNAQTTNTYDTAAVQNLTGQLNTYVGLIKTTFAQAKDSKAKQVLQQDYNAAALLLEQAKATPTTD